MRGVDAAGLSIGPDEPTRLMGVLNVSDESPYDPSVHADPADAAAFVDETLVDEGADIVDVGLESANKRFDVLSETAELERLETAIDAIESVSSDPIFSIETRYASVADAALDGGFDMVNDICGFADPAMSSVCREYDAAVVKMASPPDLERPGALETVDEIYSALQRDGLTDQTIIDPAFGGWSEDKTLADDRETFRRLREFQALGQPILVSINRKNFLKEIADRSTEAALPVSLAATAMAIERGADVVRTHDVAETRDAALVADTFVPDRIHDTDLGVQEIDVSTVQDVSRYLKDKTTEPRAVCGAVAIDRAGPLDLVLLDDLATQSGLVTSAYEDQLVLAGSVAAFRQLGTGVRDRLPEPVGEELATTLEAIGT